MTTVADTPTAVPAELMDAVLRLPPEARQALADRLIESIGGPAALSPEWRAEIERRLKDQDEGRTRYFTRDETAARLQRVVDEGTAR